jgi:hypothetical protein
MESRLWRTFTAVKSSFDLRLNLTTGLTLSTVECEEKLFNALLYRLATAKQAPVRDRRV